MTRQGTGFPQWAMVDEGWGRKAVDFATLAEPGNCREYVAVHHRPVSYTHLTLPTNREV